MARKEIEIKIEEGRDAGKTFKITEMSALQADKWVTKALCLLGKSKFDISSLGSMSMPEILTAMSGLNFEETEPLLNQLLECASFKKDGVDVPMKGSMVDSVVEDWATLFRLKVESLKLILGFLEQGGESTSE